MFKKGLLKALFVIGSIISINLPAISQSAFPTILNRTQQNFLDSQKFNIFCILRDCNGSPPSRSPEKGFCPIWPVDRGPEYLTSWSDYPTFVWVGKVKEIQIFSVEEDKIVWRKNVEPGTQTLFYTEDEEPLEPGEYDYIVSYEKPDGKIKENAPIPFEIMEKDNSNFDKAQDIENDNSETYSSLSELEKAQQKSTDFSNLGLRADAIRIVFSVDTDDPDWNAHIDSSLRDACENSGVYEE